QLYGPAFEIDAAADRPEACLGQNHRPGIDDQREAVIVRPTAERDRTSALLDECDSGTWVTDGPGKEVALGTGDGELAGTVAIVDDGPARADQRANGFIVSVEIEGAVHRHRSLVGDLVVATPAQLHRAARFDGECDNRV